jgi:hypothetical protein
VRTRRSSLRIEKLRNDMKTEKEKMLWGELYNASDPALVLERTGGPGISSRN